MVKANKRGRKPKTADYNNIFAVRLRGLIEEKGITQQQISEKISSSRQALNKWVNGETIPDILAASELADYFGVSLDYLTGRGKTRSSNEDIAIACEVTGLSEDAINKLSADNVAYTDPDFISQFLSSNPDDAELAGIGWFHEIRNKLLASDLFHSIVYNCGVIQGESEQLLLHKNIKKEHFDYIRKELNLSDKLCNMLFMRTSLESSSFFSVCSEDNCDLSRYRNMAVIEKINNMFDHRKDYMNYNREQLLEYFGITEDDLMKMEEEAENNGKHNPQKE